jgi:murein DD-endopeptidase MepM/ murein hydrolase activator NlpD
MGKLKDKESEIKKLLEKINSVKQDMNGLLAAEKETLSELSKESEMRMQLLRELQNNETKYKAILSERQKEREELNKNIESIIISRMQENIVAESVAAIISENMADHKASLSWPVSNGYIYSHFGRHAYPGMPGVYTNNSGIDIATSPFETIRTIFEGEVVGLLHISGYNWMVIIKHGEYYSVYSKLETVNISKGDMVKKNQAIGKIGRNGEFHFEIWHNKTKLNPELWLKKM